MRNPASWAGPRGVWLGWAPEEHACRPEGRAVGATDAAAAATATLSRAAAAPLPTNAGVAMVTAHLTAELRSAIVLGEESQLVRLLEAGANPNAATAEVV